jgi:hypothetical protein
MANAIIKTVTKTVEKEEKEKVYTLTLSEPEAEVIRAMVGWTVGDTGSTYSKHTYSIYNALSSARVPVKSFKTFFKFDCGYIRALPLSK